MKLFHATSLFVARAFSFSASAFGGIITLTATDDAQIHSIVPDTNLNNNLATRQSSPVYIAVMFDLSSVVGTITSAKLRIQWESNAVVGIDL